MPSSPAFASLSSRLDVPMTKALESFATCTAADPMPLPTELTRTVSPGRSSARVTSMCQAVPKAMFAAAASTSVTRSGIGMSCETLHVIFSAYPPVQPMLTNHAGDVQSDSRPVRQ